MEKGRYDVIIVGGGIMGCSTAYHLINSDNKLKIAVIEMDPTYARASSTLSMANIRIQFSLKENVQISQYAFKILERFEEEMSVNDEKPNISYHREGNLFLVDNSSRKAAEEAIAVQKRLGCEVEWWTPNKVKEHYPLYDPADCVGGTFGPQDGHLDAYSVLMAYRARTRTLGTEFLKDEVVEITTVGNTVTGVKLASGEILTAKIIVNCAGAWATKVAKTTNVNLPVVPIKRQIFTLDPAVKPEGPLPLTILPSGLYFRTEIGNLILLGKSMDEDPIEFDFTWDNKRFMEILWPELAEFVPSFDTLKLMRGWAGLYAVNTLDENAILGEWPETKGLFLANGFSGHGLQQAPAVGRYISELIIGNTISLDLSVFGPERILENKPLSEKGIV
ncbi:MAG: FAD-dependent oxidoreductase [Thermodesulfobacteriota bacterium]|nr:FAD-dependent oxidoreductase [Thermodesulfobacteriota bacterium]